MKDEGRRLYIRESCAVSKKGFGKLVYLLVDNCAPARPTPHSQHHHSICSIHPPEPPRAPQFLPSPRSLTHTNVEKEPGLPSPFSPTQITGHKPRSASSCVRAASDYLLLPCARTTVTPDGTARNGSCCELDGRRDATSHPGELDRDRCYDRTYGHSVRLHRGGH